MKKEEETIKCWKNITRMLFLFFILLLFLCDGRGVSKMWLNGIKISLTEWGCELLTSTHSLCVFGWRKFFIFLILFSFLFSFLLSFCFYFHINNTNIYGEKIWFLWLARVFLYFTHTQFLFYLFSIFPFFLVIFTEMGVAYEID